MGAIFCSHARGGTGATPTTTTRPVCSLAEHAPPSLEAKEMEMVTQAETGYGKKVANESAGENMSYNPKPGFPHFPAAQLAEGGVALSGVEIF